MALGSRAGAKEAVEDGAAGMGFVELSGASARSGSRSVVARTIFFGVVARDSSASCTTKETSPTGVGGIEIDGQGRD